MLATSRVVARTRRTVKRLLPYALKKKYMNQNGFKLPQYNTVLQDGVCKSQDALMENDVL